MGGGQGVMIIHLFLGLSLLLRAKAFTTSIDYHLLPRFYIPSLPPNLSTPTQIPLSDEQSQHALSVLRLSSTPGRRNLLRIFNQVDGEWLARVVTSKKNAPCMIELQSLLRPPPPPTQNPSLYFAPVGPKASKQVLVMGTELGVKEFTPILSDFTDGKNTKLFEEDLKSKSKLEKLLVGATGQVSFRGLLVSSTTLKTTSDTKPISPPTPFSINVSGLNRARDLRFHNSDR